YCRVLILETAGLIALLAFQGGNNSVSLFYVLSRISRKFFLQMSLQETWTKPPLKLYLMSWLVSSVRIKWRRLLLPITLNLQNEWIVRSVYIVALLLLNK